jgi:hypothetical protein
MVTAAYTDVQRATGRLQGILSGIALDYEVSDVEISRLYAWLQSHEHLLHMEPFKSIYGILNQALEDHVIDQDEREEILDWCISFSSEIPKCVTTSIRQLHGVLHGIAIDDVVTEQEIYELKDWLQDYDIFKYHWPFCDVWDMLQRILSDGVVDENEKNEMLEYCRQFSERIIPDPEIHDEMYNESYMISEAKVLQPFTELCDRECVVRFKNKRFCFTGPARTGPRKDLHAIVKSLKGKPENNVVLKLDYLVIGAQSSPAWAYSTYGRKIESVMDLRKSGRDVTILHEDDFIKQANAHNR